MIKSIKGNEAAIQRFRRYVHEYIWHGPPARPGSKVLLPGGKIGKVVGWVPGEFGVSMYWVSYWEWRGWIPRRRRSLYSRWDCFVIKRR